MSVRRSGIVAVCLIVAAASNGMADEKNRLVELALHEERGLQCADVSLTELAKELRQRFAITVMIDQRSLEEDAIPLDTVLNGNFPQVRCDTALDILLDEHSLTFIVEHGVLVLTTKTRAAESQETRVLTLPLELRGTPKDEIRVVRDAARPNANEDDYFSAATPMVGLIESLVAPDYWGKNGGVGAISVMGNLLVISATRSQNREVEQLLLSLEKAEKSDGMNPVTSHESTTKAMGIVHDLELTSATLSELLELGTEVTEIPFLIDKRALDEEAIDPDGLEFSVEIAGAEFGRALEFALRPHDLSWFIVDDVVMITTATHAEGHADVVCYPIGDLTSGKPEIAKRIIQVLQQNVAPDKWATNGGPGASLPTPSNNVLVVANTISVQAEVQALLTELRIHWDSAAANMEAQPPSIVIYPIRGKALAKQLLPLLLSEAGVSWGDGAAAHVAGKRLVVRQNSEEHAKIKKLLSRILAEDQAICPPQPAGRFGGGGFGGGGAF
jgi:hypothetical protein